jgi:hypothetical protein
MTPYFGARATHALPLLLLLKAVGGLASSPASLLLYCAEYDEPDECAAFKSCSQVYRHAPRRGFTVTGVEAPEILYRAV